TPSPTPTPTPTPSPSPTPTPQPSPTPFVIKSGDIIIDEFRLSGPKGPNDEFVELYNNTDVNITVSTTDGSGGWALAALDNKGNASSVVTTVSNGTIIPARSHFLLAASGYSLGDYAAPDIYYNKALGDDRSLALFKTSNAANFTAANRLDAAGFNNASGATAELFREGSGLSPVGAVRGEHSFVRKKSASTGLPQDSDDNAADFMLVSTTGGIFNGVQSVLGAPGPESINSPRLNQSINASLADPLSCSDCPSNRARLFCGATGTPPCDAATSPLGFLSIRRKFINRTGADVTRLRFRIVDITTLGTPLESTPQADLRAVSSSDVIVSTDLGNILVRGTTLEMSSTQALGGGVNSSLSAGTVTPTNPVPSVTPNNSINVQFMLGVKALGRFRFYIIVEAQP
ncbi:MAG TPA: lamin tail domain-containing protein, partial [Pyrinomonadaceae bacterium]|nr:lamin tail domain-containing protein [Pyrinomonadaceae bacterium]